MPQSAGYAHSYIEIHRADTRPAPPPSGGGSMLGRIRPKAGSGPDSRRWADRPPPVILIAVATVSDRRERSRTLAAWANSPRWRGAVAAPRTVLEALVFVLLPLTG